LFEHQVGGHGIGQADGGLLKHSSFVLKPLATKKGTVEKDFYEAVGKCILARYLPKYHGIVSVEQSQGSKSDYMKLEDLTQHFQRPSILDLKIGKQTWDETASKEKIKEEKSKYLYQEELGFRLTGMKIFDADKNKYCSYDKSYGRSISPKDVVGALKLFLSGAPS